MDFHLDRRLRFKSVEEIDHKNLYQRAIVEIDGAGRQVGADQIPWGWTLNFKGAELMVMDNLSFDSVDLRGNEHALTTAHRTRIRVKLHPGSMRDEEGWSDEPSYSFFGTDRVINDFQLEIVPLTADDKEGCSSWGSVSYTAEVDFTNETTTDTVQFYLAVSQAVFDRYIWNIAQGLADEVYLAVGFVDGFYAEWSPSITTRNIKVLAGSEHVVEAPDEVELPRLGKVGKAELYMLAKRQLEHLAAPETADAAGERSGFRWPGRRSKRV